MALYRGMPAEPDFAIGRYEGFGRVGIREAHNVTPEPPRSQIKFVWAKTVIPSEAALMRLSGSSLRRQYPQKNPLSIQLPFIARPRKPPHPPQGRKAKKSFDQCGRLSSWQAERHRRVAEMFGAVHYGLARVGISGYGLCHPHMRIAGKRRACG